MRHASEWALERADKIQASAAILFHAGVGVKPYDEDGIELPDAEAAKIEATRFAGGLLSDNPGQLWDKHDCRVSVTDSADHLVANVVTIAVDSDTLE